MTYVGITEIGAMFGVTRARASQITAKADFPAPYQRLAQGPIWSRRRVERWAAKNGREVASP